MKMILMVMGLMMGAAVCYAAPMNVLGPLELCDEEPDEVTVSTFAWTNMLPSGSCSGRVYVTVKPNDGNSGDLRCIMTTQSTMPVLAITKESFKVLRSGNAFGFALSPKNYLWCVDDGTAAESSFVQEFKGPSATYP